MTPGDRRRFSRQHAPLDGERTKLRGSIDKNRKGFAFISFVDRKIEDVFVPALQKIKGDAQQHIDQEDEKAIEEGMAHPFTLVIGLLGEERNRHGYHGKSAGHDQAQQPSQYTKDENTPKTLASFRTGAAASGQGMIQVDGRPPDALLLLGGNTQCGGLRGPMPGGVFTEAERDGQGIGEGLGPKRHVAQLPFEGAGFLRQREPGPQNDPVPEVTDVSAQ